jgi:CBS domain-containing protein
MPCQGRQYWVIAPYETGSLWESVWQFDLKHGVISIGWQALGDVSALSEERLRELITITYSGKSDGQKTYLYNLFRKFYYSIHVKDVVIASHGRSKIAGVGTVTRAAYYDHLKNAEVTGAELAHSNYLGVRWDDELRGKKLEGYPFPRRTLSKINEYKFYKLVDGTLGVNQAGLVPDEPDEEEPIETEEIPSREVVDAVPTIGTIVPTRKLISVAPDSEVREAINLMIRHNCSELPVIQGTRNVKGWISWKSIGREAKFHNKECNNVRDCMEEEVEVISEDKPLLEAIKIIREKDAVLVQNRLKEIIGVVTHADILARYDLLAEPFLLLGEIENHLRQLIVSVGYSLDELQAAKNPSDSRRKIESVSNLTFGEYLRLFQSTDKWSLRHANVHRETFLQYLVVVNDIRNAVMHWRPKPISEEELNELRNSVRFMRSLKLQTTA